MRRRSTSKQGLVSTLELDVTRHLTKKNSRKPNQSKKNHNRPITDKQVKILEAYFYENGMTSSLDEESLVNETGLEITQIKKWFRQRRTKARKTTSDRIMKSLHLPTNPFSSPLIAIPVSTTASASNLPPKQAVEPPTTKEITASVVPSEPPSNSPTNHQATEPASSERRLLSVNTPASNLPPNQACESASTGRLALMTKPTCNLPPNQATKPASTGRYTVLVTTSPGNLQPTQATKPATAGRPTAVSVNKPPSNFTPNQPIQRTTSFYSGIVINNGQWHLQQSSYDCCQYTLQLCDRLLQHMFGYDWITNLRLNRNI